MKILLSFLTLTVFSIASFGFAGQVPMKMTEEAKKLPIDPRSQPLKDVIPSICGNGVVEGEEECDDGNTERYDGCSCACAWEMTFAFVCGNHMCEPGEGFGGRTPCPEDCPTFGVADLPVRPHVERCGNCVVERGENCDEGDTIPGDGCDETCWVETPGGGGTGSTGGGGTGSDRGSCEYPERRPGSRMRSGVLSWCEGERTVRYVICAPSGIGLSGVETEITTNIINCGEGRRCYDGLCHKGYQCRDSDGRNEHLRGTVSIFGESASGDSTGATSAEEYEDICDPENPGQVLEMTCRPDGSLGSAAIRCVSGETCSNGSCIAASGGLFYSGSIHIAEPPSHCIDCAEFNSNATILAKPDPGKFLDDTPVATIDNGGKRVENMNGPFVIAAPFCRDTDASNLNTVGIVSGMDSDRNSYSRTDMCKNGDMVFEYLCVGDDRYTRAEMDCPFNTRCREGSCTTDTCACQRTEATSTSPGFVTQGDCFIQHDLCVGDRLVTVRCGTDGMPMPDRISLCPDGCRDGLCI